MEIEGIKLEEDVKLENAIFRLKRVHGLGCENHEAIKIVLQNLENLIKAYKETKQENKELSEANTKLAEENTKLNKIIDKMAEQLAKQYSNYEPCYLEDEIDCKKYKKCENCIKEYFREEVEE